MEETRRISKGIYGAYVENILSTDPVMFGAESLINTDPLRSFFPNNLCIFPLPLKPKLSVTMALKAVHVSDVPHLDHVPENASLSLLSTRFSQGAEAGRLSFRSPKFLVVGHRGSGMNILQSSEDKRVRAIKENSILSFNAAAEFAVDFVEFDVQVTSDDCPVIFHDDFIFHKDDKGCMFEKRVTELCLAEFLAYGPQNSGEAGKSLVRKTKDGKILSWDVEIDDSSCTLEEAFQQVIPSIGFNIELKFDDHIKYRPDQLTRALGAVLRVVSDCARDRPIIFSTFQPDAALLLRKLQDTYPVFFLTNGGVEIYGDVRRNSLEEAIKLCLEGGLQGIVSEVKAIFRNPGALAKIKESKLSFLTYGKLNNVPEAVYMQHLMGIDGVIVDFVQEITEAVTKLIRPAKNEEEGDGVVIQTKPQFSQTEISFLLKLIPELLQL